MNGILLNKVYLELVLHVCWPTVAICLLIGIFQDFCVSSSCLVSWRYSASTQNSKIEKKRSKYRQFFTTTLRFSFADNLFVQKSRLHMKLKSFPAFGTRLWNCLHPDWRKLTKRTFKRKIHKLLLTIYETEDYYVDAHSLILNLNTRIELNWINIV